MTLKKLKNQFKDDLVSATRRAASSVHGARFVAAILLAMHAGLLAWGGWCHSPTVDEVAQLPAGISHWELGRFDLASDSPPLVRMAAALPVLAVGFKTDWTALDEASGAQRATETGRRFVAANGRRSRWLYLLARWACIPFSLVAGSVCYDWARHLFGASAGLLALTLWCFSPTVLANAQMITPDTAAAALGAVACYLFWRWLREPNWVKPVLAGLALGAALLTTSVWLILYLVWPALWLVYRWQDNRQVDNDRPFSRSRLRELLQWAVILAASVYVLNVGYGFAGSFRKLGDYTFASRAFAGPESAFSGPGNRYADSWCAWLPVPAPAPLLLGIDAQSKASEDATRESVWGQENRGRCRWSRYLRALAAKTPLGTWLLAVLAILLPPLKAESKLPCRDELALLVPPVAAFTLISGRAGSEHHLGDVLGLFPFAFVWISQIAQAIDWRRWKAATLTGSGIVWIVAGSLSVYPHSLAYSNELVRRDAASMAPIIDRGQDLFYLKQWLDDHPSGSPLRLAYYGRFDPLFAGIDYTLPPQATRRMKNGGDALTLEPGWYAVSLHYVLGLPGDVPDGTGAMKPAAEGTYIYFQRFQAVERAGASINIYKLTREEVQSTSFDLAEPREPPSR